MSGDRNKTIINDAINSHCSEKNIIPETQFGFRFHHSTVHAITKFTSDICWVRKAGDCVGECFIDLEKAFDTVWLDELFFKLLKKDFPKHLIKILWDMLHEKRFFVTEGNSKSTRDFLIANGLQQGTVNSPILFNIYISDLLQMYGLNNTDEKTNKSAIAFADDLLIYIKNSKPSIIKTQSQDLFEKGRDYFQTWKLKINTQKSHDINEKIPHKDTVRYLGVFLDFKLNHNIHVNIQIQKASRAFIANRSLFHSKELHKSVKIICYKTLIRPILTYGCQIWFNIFAGTMEKLRVFERKCIRACLGKYRSPESNYTKLISNYKLYEEAMLVRIDFFMVKLIRDHWSK
ncbi:PREDICTED: RNA-directed DNA polymerase from mobile element jockey-like, partial [Dufourea novaeangliae]|uniref:RNA-directed DNA polymerase from mobile element jockey-like n=1 Tax=Dufourea novaeangliae TaxID=178035 RepID=UPI0007676660